MPTALITGGAGFIGSNLARFLLTKGHEVIVIDNLLTGSIENITPVADQIQFVEGDIRDRDLMRELCAGVDVIFHQAALPSVPRSIDDPWKTNDHNVNGTMGVLEAARDAEVRRVVYAASSSVYGDTKVLPKEETMCACPKSPYAVSKHIAELYGSVFSDVYGLETVGLRYFNVFGPQQSPDSAYAAAIPKFIDRFRQGKPPVIYGDGEQTRDFTFVENVLHANWQAAHAPAENVTGELFNVGCGDRITVNELVQEIRQILDADIDPVHDDPRPGDVRHSLADISKAQAAFGYEPLVSLHEGLRRTIDWFVSQEDTVSSNASV